MQITSIDALHKPETPHVIPLPELAATVKALAACGKCAAALRCVMPVLG